MTPREQLHIDVLFVGGGPACLAGAVHLAGMAAQRGTELEIGLIEKGADMGDHSLSGAVLDPIALSELIPDFIEAGCPVREKVDSEAWHVLTREADFRLPWAPARFSSHGCYTVSLSEMVRWLASVAQDRGVNVFPGFSGAGVLFDSGKKCVAGVRTGDMGVGKDGKKKSVFQPGADLFAKIIVFGEGPRGSLAREVDQVLGIYPRAMPQIYETAVKEVIEVPDLKAGPVVMHTMGHPLAGTAKGGGFLYHMGENRVSLGLVVGLDYDKPQTDPHELFSTFKDHPFIASRIAGGRVLEHGAKTLCVGGFHTRPRLSVGGAMFVGETASMLNPARLKGIHTAMKSGMLAAQSCIQALEAGDFSEEGLSGYARRVDGSWLGRELFAVRNFSQALSKDPVAGTAHLAAQMLSGGKGLRDPLPTRSDWRRMKKITAKAARSQGLPPVAVDNGRDRLTGVYLSGTMHEEDQPCHIRVKDVSVCVGQCFEQFHAPCIRFCPAGVYEMDTDGPGERRFRVNPANCLHCKTCEIKDPCRNVTWSCPEGGGGPRYRMM